MTVSRQQLSPQGPNFSRFIAGYWRLADWNMSAQQCLGFLNEHLELGVTSVDHADIYGDYRVEKLFGDALALQPELRSKMEIVSKCGIKLVSPARPDHRLNHYDTSSAHIIASVDNSLANLRTDYLDLLLIHRPDPLMNVDDIAAAFDNLKRAGKVRHFGVSNFTPAQCAMLQSRLDEPLVTNQVELSPANMSVLHDGTLDYCQQHHMAPMIWSALGGGQLFTSNEERFQRIREVLAVVGEQHDGASADQLVYAWIMNHPSRPLPLIGSGNIARYRTALAAESIQLDRQQWFSIWRAAAGHDVP